MMHLNSILQTPWHQSKHATKLLFLAGFFGLAGFLDATYLTIVHYKNLIPPCSAVTNCELVLTSKYAVMFGIPIALVGAFYYAVLIATLLLLHQERKRIFRDFAFLLVCVSMVISVVLVYIQAQVLHAFCQYCLLSEGINTVLFILVIGLIFPRQKT